MPIGRTFPALALAGVLTTAAGSALAAGPHTGVTVNIMTFTGPITAEPLQRRAPDFEKLTGAKINIVTVPFADLYTKVLTDWASGTNSIDAAVIPPQWAVDYIVPGYMQDLSASMAADKGLQEDDIAPFFRDFSQKYKSKSYLVTMDGDFQMVYYRTDVLKSLGLNPPQTWDDYLAIAKAANGKDHNGDGKPDYGSCIAKKRNAQSYWMFMSIAASYLQSQGTSQGMFFDTKTGKPLVNNKAFGAALDTYAETGKYGPPDEINHDIGDTRSLFMAGRCALTLDWGDTGTLAIDAKTSKVMDKVAAVILPGSRKVLDRVTGKLAQCDAKLCPYAIDGVNHAPYAAFGGWSGGVNAKAKDAVKRAAYDFFSYVSNPAQSSKDVTLGQTGFNPYRLSHFQNIQLWMDAGMSKAAAENYLGAIKASLQSPNMVLDLRIPKNQAYQQVALDTALARFLSGGVKKAQTMSQLQKAWEELNQDNGADKQLAAYRATLGLDK